MNFNPQNNDDLHSIAEINIVPLVDIMLVLLIIFMVTAPLSISGVEIVLPKSKSIATKVENDRIILTVDSKGGFFIEKMSVPVDSLKDKLQTIYSNRNNKDLYIRADKSVVYGRVIDAMSAAKQAGAEKITMLTENSTK